MKSDLTNYSETPPNGHLGITDTSRLRTILVGLFGGLRFPVGESQFSFGESRIPDKKDKSTYMYAHVNVIPHPLHLGVLIDVFGLHVRLGTYVRLGTCVSAEFYHFTCFNVEFREFNVFNMTIELVEFLTFSMGIHNFLKAMAFLIFTQKTTLDTF